MNEGHFRKSKIYIYTWFHYVKNGKSVNTFGISTKSQNTVQMAWLSNVLSLDFQHFRVSVRR